MRTVILLVLLALLYTVTNAAVIGIDLGSDTFKIGIAKSGAPIDLVLNEQSKRKTSTMVGFRGDYERYLGENALQQSSRFPDMMFKYLQLLLAQPPGSPQIKRLEELYVPIRTVQNERGSVDVLVRDEKTKYSVEELFGMIFKYIKELSKDSAKSIVADAVITIPAWFSLQQRQAILDAASISDLKVLALLHENTAAAIQYGISKHKTLRGTLSTDDYILTLIDFGHLHLTTSVYNYTFSNTTLGTLELLSVSYDAYLGGADFDLALANYFADNFQEKYKHDVRKDPRAMTRLIQQARRTKEVLSANAETFAQVESLYDDKDFRLLVTREKFIELTKPLLDRVKKVVSDAIKDIERIDAVELIGGSNRIPAVQQNIKEGVGNKVSNLGFSLNADEAISLGAAFHAASLGSSFRVKAYQVIDKHFGINYTLDNELLTIVERIAHRQAFNLTKEQDFSVSVNYKKLPDNIEKSEIAKYDISNVTETIGSWPNEPGKYRRVQLFVGTNRHGMPVVDAQAIFEETITVRVLKPQNKFGFKFIWNYLYRLFTKLKNVT
jgi:molecular chaperone DnaK (HSP70)